MPSTIVSSPVSNPKSLQIVGSKALGGAEGWCLRFCAALAERGAPAELAIRAGSELDSDDLPSLPVHRLPFRTVWDPFSRSAVARLLKQTSPDVVQTYMGRATRSTRIPRGAGPVHVARLGGYYALHAYRHAHAWIGNTKRLCRWMIEQGLPSDRVFHIYNFASRPNPRPAQQIEQLRHSLNLPDDAWLLASFGRFVPFKGHAYLLRALSLLPAKIGGRPWRLIVVGDGVLGRSLRKQAQEAGVAERIHWAGWQRDPGPFFQLADLVVFPSLEGEPLGNVILEAWAWERPLVTTLCLGASEIAHHEKDAWCVPCADSRALAQGIELVLRSPALARALVEGGRGRVLTEFGREPIMNRYLELYRDLAGRH